MIYIYNTFSFIHILFKYYSDMRILIYKFFQKIHDNFLPHECIILRTLRYYIMLSAYFFFIKLPVHLNSISILLLLIAGMERSKPRNHETLEVSSS